MNEQWKKAVIHLECATDSEQVHDQRNRRDELYEQHLKGEVSFEEYTQQLDVYGRDIRCQGTAIFLIHNERRYLLTARHVLFDEIASEINYQKELKECERLPDYAQGSYLDFLNKERADRIFNAIFKVPSLDEAIAGLEFRNLPQLVNLYAGPSEIRPYTFTTPDLDLAIISLDNRDTRFADDLIALGYCPISSELIDECPTSEGAEVFTVGFPGATALITQVNQTPEVAVHSSSFVSLPVSSWGRVSMLHPQLPFYWCDMSIYPGNSGGPLIENGKLVGIVSAQATQKIEGMPLARAGIPFAKIIKAGFIKHLLEVQEAKDKPQWRK